MLVPRLVRDQIRKIDTGDTTWARILVEEYDHPKSNLGIEIKINIGRPIKADGT